ncbi:Uncharacterised protein [Mycobacterium tuberculosis]|nr:Uncharacterised protein [Mycobacterium tuberculosis]
MLGIDSVSDDGAVQIRELSIAMQVPPPPKQRWTAAVVVVYLPNAFNIAVPHWGVVQDRVSCRYSVEELLDNALLIIQNLRRTNQTGFGGTVNQ